MDTALVGYEQKRDALTRNGLELTFHTATLAPLSARLESSYRAVVMRPELTRQIAGVMGGSVPFRPVYSPSAIYAASHTTGMTGPPLARPRTSTHGRPAQHGLLQERRNQQ